jgi:hypothetical protein
MLYNRYFTLLFRRVYAKIKNEEIARDILQETWMKVWEEPDFILKKEIQLNAFLLKHCDYRILIIFETLNIKLNSLRKIIRRYLMMNIWKYWIPLIQKSCCRKYRQL